jgi:heterodisulfide reductase subunit C
MQAAIMTKIPISIMGRKYLVPQGLTIMKALEYAGHRITRGCGCRGGVCGACVTVYRKTGDYRLRVGLACQTLVEPEIYLTQLPYIPANKAIYAINAVSLENVNAIYPEIMRCVACNTCTKSCPMELEVMNYMSAAIRGDLFKVVELSMECVMCGMCAERCPAELSPFNVALLVRRVYGKHAIPPAEHLKKRLQEIEAGRYTEQLELLKQADKSELEERYKELQATKGVAV